MRAESLLQVIEDNLNVNNILAQKLKMTMNL